MATGAVNRPTERAYNSNGYYLKFADGTLIQWGGVNGITFNNTDAIKTGTLTFPIAFADTEARITANCYATSVANYVYRVAISQSSKTEADWSMAPSSPQAATNRGFSWIAIGRWK